MNKILNTEFLALSLAIIGVIVGVYLPSLALGFSFLGEIFILLLKMLIIPLVFTSIFLSITGLPLNEVKKLGSKTLLYYLFTSAMACVVGIVIANVFIQGSITLDNLSFETPKELKAIDFHTFIKSFFTGNFFQALSAGNIVQIVAFTLILSFAALKLPESKKGELISLATAVQELMTIVIEGVLKVAPIGIFSLIASLVAKTDPSAFKHLVTLFYSILIAVVIHIIFTLGLLSKFVGDFSLFKFIFKVRKALLVALTTASSTATLPISTQVLNENVKVKPKTSGFVLPLGATLNMDGSALYQSLVIIFLAQFSHIQLGLYEQLVVFFFVMTSSAGTAGIPGGGIMMMSAVMSMVGIPLELIGIYLLIDRFWDYPITMVNVLGDLVAAKTVDRFID